MPNKIKSIPLSEDDKTKLNQLIRQRTLDARVYIRAKILLLKNEGHSNEYIADKLDIVVNSVRNCLNKYALDGIEGALYEKKGRGRKPEIADDDIAWVINKACQKPKEFGFSAELWYPTSLTRYINSVAEAEGHPRMATVSETTLRRILANAKIKPFKIVYYCEKRDPDFDAKMHDVLVIYKQIAM